MRVLANGDCPCGSGDKFKRCCRAYHRGAEVPTPEALVRARYSAYLVGDVPFIQETTHPAAGQYKQDRKIWAREIQEFSRSTGFDGLRILSSEVDGDQGEVTFHARLNHDGEDASFTERSRFRRQGGKWKYLAAVPE